MRLDLNRLSIWTAGFCTYYRELRTIECTYYREMTVNTFPKNVVIFFAQIIIYHMLITGNKKLCGVFG